MRRAISRASATLRAMPFSGCFWPSLLQQRPELLPVAGGVEGVDGRAQDRHPGFLQAACEVERRLPAELDDDA